MDGGEEDGLVAFSYNASLALADCSELRASALAALGDVLATAGGALPTPVLRDVLGGLDGILRMERPKLKQQQQRLSTSGGSDPGSGTATNASTPGSPYGRGIGIVSPNKVPTAPASTSTYANDADASGATDADSPDTAAEVAEAAAAAEVLIDECAARVRRAAAQALRAFIDGCGGGASALGGRAGGSTTSAPAVVGAWNGREMGAVLSPTSVSAAMHAALRQLPGGASPRGRISSGGSGDGRPTDLLSRGRRQHVPQLYSVLRYAAESDPDAATRGHATDALVAAEAVALGAVGAAGM